MAEVILYKFSFGSNNGTIESIILSTGAENHVY